MTKPTPAPDANRPVPQPAVPTPTPPDPSPYDPRLIAAALNAFTAVVRWLDHHMGGWPM